MNSIVRRPEQLVRVNPYQGLMIDAAIWSDAHASHRDELRLHQLALHGWGIVDGLEVTPRSGTTVEIRPGLGVDPAGNFIIVDAPYEFQVTSQSGTVYLVLKYREVPTGPSQVGPDGTGRTPRLRAAFSVIEERVLPSEPYLELARITLEPGVDHVGVARDPASPGRNELDLRFRSALSASASGSGARTPRPLPTRSALTVGLVEHHASGWDCHRAGIGLLVREIEFATGRSVQTHDTALPLTGNANLLYLSGYGALSFDALQRAALRLALDRGVIAVGDGCSHGPQGLEGARAFAESFRELGRQRGMPLLGLDQEHALLRSRYVFGEPPAGGSGVARVFEGGNLVYCEADYGCAWGGGAIGQPLARATIRDALEFGVNLAVYAGGD